MKKNKSESLLFKNFVNLGLVIFVIVAAICYIIYQNAINTMNRELQYQNQINTKKIQTLADTVFREIELIIADVQTNSNVGLYIAGDESYGAKTDLYYQVSQKVSSYPIIYKYIHSVYIYSEKGNRVFASENQMASSFRDNSWIPKYENSQYNETVIWGRKINGVYPSVITFMKKVSKYNNDGAILINVNMKEMGNLFGSSTDENQHIYIVNDENEILYSKDPEYYLKNFSEISFDKKNIVSKIHSENYDWSYNIETEIGNYNKNLETTRRNIMFVIFGLLLLGLMITIFIAFNSYKPVQNIMSVLDMPEKWTGKNKDNSSSEVKYIVDKIITTINENDVLHKELESRLKMLNNVNIKALQAQLNPHFLANTLNLINLIMVDEVGKNHPCPRMLSDLSKLLRYTLVMNENVVSINTEIKYAKLCVNILKERYEDLFSAYWDIDPDTLNCNIIKLGLQPIIENAVYHGICPKGEVGILKIEAKIINDCLQISVCDNGVGMSTDVLSEIRATLNDDITLDSEHVGIKNVHQRIKLIFGDKYGIKINSKENVGTDIIMTFPL